MGSGTFGTLHSRMRELVFEKGMSFDEAAAQAQREYESHGPAPVGNLTGRQLQEQLQNGLNEVLPQIQKTAKKDGGVYNSTLTPEQMEQRYQYSLKCRNILTKIVEESVRRDKVFQDTATRLFGDNPFDQPDEFDPVTGEKTAPPRVDQMRWMEQLMRLDDTEEARYHNEEVVSLVMLGEYTSMCRTDPTLAGDPEAAKKKAEKLEAGRKKFRDARYDHYAKDLKLPPEEANKRADDDLNKGIERLSDLTLELMDKYSCKREEADKARDAILTGTAEQTYPGGLEAAYRKIVNPGNAVAWNINNAHSNLKSFGLETTEEAYRQKYRPYEINSTVTHSAIACQVANPYYAVLDSAKLANANIIGLGAKGEESALVDFGGDMTGGLLEARQDAMKQAVRRFGFKTSEDRAVQKQPDNISIYSDRAGRSMILVGRPISVEHGLDTGIDINLPGRLINDNFDQLVSKRQADCMKEDKLFRSSSEYRAMKRALNALPGIKIPDNGDPEKLDELERKLKPLEKAVKAYLDKKDRQFKERGAMEGKSPYERTRYKAAKDLKSFVGQMRTRIDLIREHQSTVTGVLEQERLAALQEQPEAAPEVEDKVEARAESKKEYVNKEAPKKEEAHKATGDPKRFLDLADRRMVEQAKASEAALAQGNTKKAVELGVDALALQTVCGLIRGTAGKAGDPDALREMVHRSDRFQEETAKFDFSKSGVLKQAIEMKVGAKISVTLLNLQKKGGDLGRNGMQNVPSVQNEQNKQKQNVIV